MSQSTFEYFNVLFYTGKWFVSTGKDNLLNAWRTPYGASIFQVWIPNRCMFFFVSNMGKLSWNCSYFQTKLLFHQPCMDSETWGADLFSIFSLFFFVSSLKSHPRCWAAIYPWMTSTLSPDQGTRRQLYTRSSIKKAEMKKGRFSFLARPVCSWRLSRVAKKNKTAERATFAPPRFFCHLKRCRKVTPYQWVWLEQLGLGIIGIFCLLVNKDNWDQILGPVLDLGKAGIWFEWDQLIWRTMQPGVRIDNHLILRHVQGQRPVHGQSRRLNITS